VGARSSPKGWPTFFKVSFFEEDTIIEIGSVALECDDYNMLRNAAFADGLDHWFYYSDFSRLPWNVKNLFLNIWFEIGGLGLVLFLTMLVLLGYTNFERHAPDSLLPVYTAGVVTLCLFGLFYSPLDSARVSWIFYFFIGAGLAKLRLASKSLQTSPRKRRADRSGTWKFEPGRRRVQ
jgi:O-antigen ligase